LNLVTYDITSGVCVWGGGGGWGGVGRELKSVQKVGSATSVISTNLGTR